MIIRMMPYGGGQLTKAAIRRTTARKWRSRSLTRRRRMVDWQWLSRVELFQRLIVSALTGMMFVIVRRHWR